MQDLLVTWFGATGATLVRYAVALIVVVGLLLLLRWVLRTYAVGGQLSIGRGRQNRLTVVDSIAIDQRRRLLLVRRDNVEHLILIGGGNDLLVEPTIIKGVPVGTLGRTGRAAPPPAHSGDADPVVADGPHEPPVVSARAPAMTPPHVGEPASQRPAFSARVVDHAKANSIQSRINRMPLKAPEPPRAEASSPYIPPEAHRLEPTATTISPIVADKTDHGPDTRAAPAAEPAPVTEDAGFEDLARQLDEALKSEINDLKVAEAAQAAAPEPAAVEPAPRIEPPKPVVPAASAWLRPRNAPTSRPVATREPTVPVPAVKRVAPAPRVSVEPAAPAEEPFVAPEPVVTPRVSERAAPPAPVRLPVETPVEPPEAAPKDGDFSSLESEMARLLDELAGDSKGKR